MKIENPPPTGYQHRSPSHHFCPYCLFCPLQSIWVFILIYGIKMLKIAQII